MKFDGEYEVYHTKDSGFSLKYSESAIKIKEFSESSGYGIRVLSDKKIGFSFGDKEEEIKNYIAQAQKATPFAVKSDFSFQKKSKYPSLLMVDKKIKDMTIEELKEALLEVKQGAQTYTDNIRIYMNNGSQYTKIENTNDLLLAYEKTNMGIYVEATKGEGFGYASYSGCFLPKSFEEFGKEAGTMAQQMEHPKKIKTGKYTVLFEIEALNDLCDVFLPSFLGDWKRRKISFLTEKQGEQLFDEKFSVYDDATTSGVNMQPADDEGTKSKRIPLVEKGVVKQFIYDRATAALDTTNEEGGCTRSDFSAFPTIGHSNIVISGGTDADVIEELNGYILVKSLHGTHTANTTTGDFGVEVNIAWHVKKDEKIPVRGFILSGNIFNLFKRIRGVEKEVKVYGNFIAPRIACDDVQVVG